MMVTFIIDRHAENKHGTFGILSQFIDEKIPFAVTLEKPWKNNEKNNSCIPPGIYYCSRFPSSKFGDTFEVINVYNRDAILFHWGNLSDDTEGCILVAEKYGMLHGRVAVLESNKPSEGFNEFMAKAGVTDRFKLIINDFTRIYG